jgi:hypothetical protein
VTAHQKVTVDPTLACAGRRHQTNLLATWHCLLDHIHRLVEHVDEPQRGAIRAESFEVLDILAPDGRRVEGIARNTDDGELAVRLGRGSDRPDRLGHPAAETQARDQTTIQPTVRAQMDRDRSAGEAGTQRTHTPGLISISPSRNFVRS